jgi:GMP synthase (glutamine-hydrolysing)
MLHDPAKFIDDAIHIIRERVGSTKAVVAASGGVDSTTTALLGKRALGENLIVLFLDDGLMRKDEPESVVKFYKELGFNVRLLDVKEEFLTALKGLSDPEDKRKAFRETFYRVLSRALKDIGARFLLQGTIAADVVETKKGVKTQHNVLEQIGIHTAKTYGYELIEPLKDLYKDEVRQIAKALGLPLDKVERRPFPGPGLSIRILGEVTEEKVELIRKATAIVEEETDDMKCFQAFAVLANDKSTGISESGGRIYGNIIIIRIVDSKDAMTAIPSEISWIHLRRIRDRILKEIPSVTRVLYDITPKPPATIEFE